MSQDALPSRMATIRARAREHQESIESRRWFTPQQLAAMWNLAASTIRDIPRAELPYKEFGNGAKKRRRYHPDAVAAFEASGRLPGRAE